MKVVVDVKVTSTDQLNKAFDEKDEKYREWATNETREKKVSKVVMVPIIISNEGQSTVTQSSAGRTSPPISRLTGYELPRTSSATMSSSLGCSSTRAAGSRRRGERSTLKHLILNMRDPQNASKQQKSEGTC